MNDRVRTMVYSNLARSVSSHKKAEKSAECGVDLFLDGSFAAKRLLPDLSFELSYLELGGSPSSASDMVHGHDRCCSRRHRCHSSSTGLRLLRSLSLSWLPSFKKVPISRDSWYDHSHSRQNRPSNSHSQFYTQDKRLVLSLHANRQVVGTLRGFDAFGNVVLQDASEQDRFVGQVVIRGNAIVQMEGLERTPAASES